MKQILSEEEIAILLESIRHEFGSIDILSGKDEKSHIYTQKILKRYKNSNWIFDYLPQLRTLGLINYNVFYWTFSSTSKGKLRVLEILNYQKQFH